MILLGLLSALLSPRWGLSSQTPSSDTLYRQGIEQYNQGNVEEAIQLLRRAIALRPNVPDYRYSLGLAYLRAKRAKEAARELEAARGMMGLRRDTRAKEPEVLVHLATAYLALDDLVAARKRVEVALEREPESAEAHYVLGLVVERSGDRELAAEHFKKTLTLEPDHPQANAALARWLEQRGEEEAALERWRHASRAAPEDFLLQMSWGAAAFARGEKEEALAAFERASRLQPDNDDARFNLGTVLVANGAYGRAIEVLEPMTQRPNPHEGALFNLAQALRGAGRIAQAVGVLETLALRSPGRADLHFTLGLVKEELGDDEGAEAAYRRQIELFPEAVPAYLNLAVLLQKKGETKVSLALLREAQRRAESDPDESARIASAIAAIEKSR